MYIHFVGLGPKKGTHKKQGFRFAEKYNNASCNESLNSICVNAMIEIRKMFICAQQQLRIHAIDWVQKRGECVRFILIIIADQTIIFFATRNSIFASGKVLSHHSAHNF